MLKKRIIPCLDIKEGRTVKGVNFVDIQDAGDPIELAKRYVEEGADELVFLDITASIENRETILSIVEQVSKNVFIPLTVGGGIKVIDDIKKLSESEGFERFGIIKSTRNRDVDNEIDEIVLPEGYKTVKEIDKLL